MEEKHAYRLLRDLFEHKDVIFNELKRLATLQHSSSLSGKRDGAQNSRPRATSRDESKRRVNMEERNRLLIEKSAAQGSRSPRATSPAASFRHRRDRSVGGPETRFPVQVGSPTQGSNRASLSSAVGGKRQSLEVPGVGSPDGGSNGGAVDDIKNEEGLSKRNSLSRSSHANTRFVGGRRVTLGRDGQPGTPSTPTKRESLGPGEHAPVTLVDRPMDD
ncbi:MAG: hypothetical protein MJA30_15835 [Cytophagales bacterium]|nr:hypothetical protein [Cytophagales bacterium]